LNIADTPVFAAVLAIFWLMIARPSDLTSHRPGLPLA
jgi:hypothetical protein